MALYTIADLHLSLGVKKPMDIFQGWQDYVQRLESNWISLVGEEDTVVIPGDISWGIDLQEAREDLLFLERLPGRKILIKGNHDYWWPSRAKSDQFFEEQGISSVRMIYHDAVLVDGIAVCGTRSWFYEEGDTENKVYRRELMRLQMSLEEAKKLDAGEIIAFLHYPPVYGEYVYEDYIELMRVYGVRQCYYGHLHGKARALAVNREFRGIRFRLVSADELQFCPLRVIV